MTTTKDSTSIAKADSKADFYNLETLPSTSTLSAPPPYNSTTSFQSLPTSTTSSPLLPTSFTPTSTLQIQCLGKVFFSAPMPTKELSIPIFRFCTATNTTTRPVYLSIRPTRRSGSCRLVDAEDAHETALARTTYTFGPFRDPVVRIGGDDEGVEEEVDEFEMKSKGTFTRAIVFESRTWGRCEWRYAKRSERGEGVDSLLLLERVRGTGVQEERTLVARLVRGEGWRAAGSKKSSWGNGGRLEMIGVEQGGVDEVVVVVTVLVMLKKEVDQLRGLQIAAMSGHGGGC